MSQNEDHVTDVEESETDGNKISQPSTLVNNVTPFKRIHRNLNYVSQNVESGKRKTIQNMSILHAILTQNHLQQKKFAPDLESESNYLGPNTDNNYTDSLEPSLKAQKTSNCESRETELSQALDMVEQKKQLINIAELLYIKEGLIF